MRPSQPLDRIVRGVAALTFRREAAKKLCGGQRPFPAPWAGMGEEAATPGHQHALTRISGKSPGNSPSRIAGCRCIHRNLPVSSKTLTLSMNPLWATLLRIATGNTCALVQNLWTLRFPCGRVRKT